MGWCGIIMLYETSIRKTVRRPRLVGWEAGEFEIQDAFAAVEPCLDKLAIFLPNYARNISIKYTNQTLLDCIFWRPSWGLHNRSQKRCFWSGNCTFWEAPCSCGLAVFSPFPCCVHGCWHTGCFVEASNQPEYYACLYFPALGMILLAMIPGMTSCGLWFSSSKRPWRIFGEGVCWTFRLGSCFGWKTEGILSNRSENQHISVDIGCLQTSRWAIWTRAFLLNLLPFLGIISWCYIRDADELFWIHRCQRSSWWCVSDVGFFQWTSWKPWWNPKQHISWKSRVESFVVEEWRGEPALDPHSALQRPVGARGSRKWGHEHVALASWQRLDWLLSGPQHSHVPFDVYVLGEKTHILQNLKQWREVFLASDFLTWFCHLLFHSLLLPPFFSCHATPDASTDHTHMKYLFNPCWGRQAICCFWHTWSQKNTKHHALILSSNTVSVFPQRRKLMGSSAQISSGVCRCGSQEQVPEGSGRFRRVPACAGVGSGGRFRKVPEGSGRFWRVPARVGVGSGGRFRKVPESSGVVCWQKGAHVVKDGVALH